MVVISEGGGGREERGAQQPAGSRAQARVRRGGASGAPSTWRCAGLRLIPAAHQHVKNLRIFLTFL